MDGQSIEVEIVQKGSCCELEDVIEKVVVLVDGVVVQTAYPSEMGEQ